MGTNGEIKLHCRNCKKNYDLKIESNKAYNNREHIVRCPHCNAKVAEVN